MAINQALLNEKTRAWADGHSERTIEKDGIVYASNVKGGAWGTIVDFDEGMVNWKLVQIP